MVEAGSTEVWLASVTVKSCAESKACEGWLQCYRGKNQKPYLWLISTSRPFLYPCTIFSMAAIYLRKNSPNKSYPYLSYPICVLVLLLWRTSTWVFHLVCQNIPSTWCFYFLEVDKVNGRKIWQRQLMAGEKCSDMGKKRIYASTQWHTRRHHNSDHFCPMFSPDTSSVCDNLTLGDRFTVQNVKKKRMWILLVQLFTWNGNLSSETVDPFTKVLGRTQRPGSR